MLQHLPDPQVDPGDNRRPNERMQLTRLFGIPGWLASVIHHVVDAGRWASATGWSGRSVSLASEPPATPHARERPWPAGASVCFQGEIDLNPRRPIFKCPKELSWACVRYGPG